MTRDEVASARSATRCAHEPEKRGGRKHGGNPHAAWHGARENESGRLIMRVVINPNVEYRQTRQYVR